MAKRVKKAFKGSKVTIRMCQIELSNPTPQQLEVLEKYRPELLEDEPKTKSRKSD